MSGSTTEGILGVVEYVWQLDSFLVFCGYVLMVLLARIWKKYTKPLELRPVSIISYISNMRDRQM